METTLVRSFSGNTTLDMSVHKAILENDTQLLTIDPYLPFPRKNLAGAYYSLGQRDRAMAELRRAIDYEPNYVPAYLVMGSWYAERGQAAEGARYTAIGVAIVNKYRDFKPHEIYERILLGRPEPSTPDRKYQ
jgi:tetratricopeptide (TPR) repeat protein